MSADLPLGCLFSTAWEDGCLTLGEPDSNGDFMARGADGSTATYNLRDVIATY